LLPSDPETDALPERSKEKMIEKRTIEDYALFMPTISRFWPVGNEPLNFNGPKKETIGTWVMAEFDARTATIKKLPSHGNTFSKIPGWHYVVTQNDIDGNTWHGQISLSSPGTALPFQCPACGISYKQVAKSSPLRGFRAGFSKTTQLLSSALIGELKKVDKDEKLICFSDSRQDAAHAALDLESGHHNDVRRELIIRMLEQINSQKKSSMALKEELVKINSKMQELVKIDNPSDDIFNQIAEILERRKNINSQLIYSNNDSIPLKDILCPVSPQPNTGVGAILSSLIDKGIHPIDPTGIGSLPLVKEGHGVDAHFSWQQIFTRGVKGEWLWRDGPYDALKISRDEIADNLLQLISETIFNKTYFAVEESGWGYPCLDLKSGETRDGLACYDAMLRILSDFYRFIPAGKYEKKNWTKLSDANKKMRDYVKKYCVLNGGTPEFFFSNFITRLSQSGHDVGKIFINKIFYRSVNEDAPYWRCVNCGRVHLHIGGKICTRCLALLPSEPTGITLELRSNNFLGKRIQNSSGIYRVRAEELTGMTGNQSARLRRFKNIFIQDDDDILPTGPASIVADPELEELAKAIDILSVTTTMEVGVDIGSLKSIFQANMPPQRFNYQQRVGRAGRRGQSFSYVLTICRSKSHDLHYFFNPREITGDPPPPPFLTSNLDQIAIRIASKYWMVKAFKLIKSLCQGEWDGDELRLSPDNHGEFVSIKKIMQDKESWINKIKSALKATSAEKDGLLLLCVGGDFDRAKSISSLLTEDYLANEINKLLEEPSVVDLGLAEALAEHGVFPMYGMPTRVRKLYIKADKHLSNDDNDEVVFKSFDRDLDVAIQEFAPGKYLVHDKSRYFTSGYVGSELRRDRGSSQEFVYDSIPKDLGERRYLIECPVCLSWSRVMSLDSNILDCECCGKSQIGSLINTTFVPLNFIGSMDKISFKEKSLEEQPSKASRTSIAEAKRIDTILCLGTNLKFGVSSTSQIFRLNRGQLINNKWTGFGAKRGNLIVPYKELGSSSNLKLKNVWIDNEAFELDQSQSPLKQRFFPYPFNHNNQENNNFYLCSPKVTDSIIFELNSVNPALDIMKSQNHSRLEFSSAFRAGAISACYHIVNFASRVKLDVDPDEFEILDPRIQVREDGARIPLLQISDELINGSGLTNRLGQLIHSQPLFLDVIHEIMSNKPKSPSFEYMQNDHPKKCLTGCYRCLHRYGNQHYHGLLDWRLGFNILSMFLDESYSAGIDGNFDHSGLRDWEIISKTLAEEASIFLQTQIKTIEGINIIDLGNDIWAGIIHPLWSKNEVFERYSELAEFAGEVSKFDFISTFSLSRNMGETLLNFKAKSLDHFSN
jgi:hypothetical protein